MSTRSIPKKTGYFGNYCAYCYHWDGNIKLSSYSRYNMEFDVNAKGMCLYNGRRTPKTAGNCACHDFQLSYEAARYAR